MATDLPRPSRADVDRVLAASDALMHRVMASHAPELNTIELTMSQTKAIYLVVADGPLRMTELAGRLHVTNSTATGLVDRLVELGMLERHESPGDRRQVVVSATAHGIEALERFRELSTHRMRQMLSRLDRADLATVERGFHILTAVVDDTPFTTTSTAKGNRS